MQSSFKPPPCKIPSKCKKQLQKYFVLNDKAIYTQAFFLTMLMICPLTHKGKLLIKQGFSKALLLASATVSVLYLQQSQHYIQKLQNRTDDGIISAVISTVDTSGSM